MPLRYWSKSRCNKHFKSWRSCPWFRARSLLMFFLKLYRRWGNYKWQESCNKCRWGVRTGFDVVKMLALGADYVLIGRPLAREAVSNGAGGVKRVLEYIQTDIRIAMLMTSCNNLKDIKKRSISGYIAAASPRFWTQLKDKFKYFADELKKKYHY